MLKKIISFFLVAIFCSSFLTSCKQTKKNVVETFEYFDTYSTLTVYSDIENFEIYQKEFFQTLDKYHKLFDIYHSYDDIINLKDINEKAAISPIKVSDELFSALEFGKEAYNLTCGKCNIAIGSLSSIWHDIREKANSSNEEIILPTEESLKSALNHIDINSLVLDSEDKTVFFNDSSLSLDFGSIAKGYVASLLYNSLLSLECESFLINLGGNTVSHGRKPDNSLWNAIVENPFDSKELGYNNIIFLNDSTLVTSGTYQRFFTYNDKNYSHIIDTENGYPSDRFTSVSVFADSSLSGEADALSTALLCMSYEDGEKLISSLDGFSALWIFNDGSYKISIGFGGAK